MNSPHQPTMKRKKPLPPKDIEERLTEKEKFVKKWGKGGKIKDREKG